MPTLRMTLSLTVMVPLWAVPAGLSRLDSPGADGVVGGMAVGALIGAFFGLVFGGAKGRWLDHVFGPELGESDRQETEAGWTIHTGFPSGLQGERRQAPADSRLTGSGGSVADARDVPGGP
jgi:hypothetical protein